MAHEIGLNGEELERLYSEGYTIIVYKRRNGGELGCDAWEDWKCVSDFPDPKPLPHKTVRAGNAMFFRWMRRLKAEGYDAPDFLKQCKRHRV